MVYVGSTTTRLPDHGFRQPELLNSCVTCLWPACPLHAGRRPPQTGESIPRSPRMRHTAPPFGVRLPPGGGSLAPVVRERVDDRRYHRRAVSLLWRAQLNRYLATLAP